MSAASLRKFRQLADFLRTPPRESGDLPGDRSALDIIQVAPMQVSIENKRKGIDCIG